MITFLLTFFSALIGIHIFRQIKKERTEDDDFLSYVLGWCAEIMQACALVADDIIDGSETRRGSPCWYTLDEVGLSAINGKTKVTHF
jgi:farnesyl diphosphate synthase